MAGRALVRPGNRQRKGNQGGGPTPLGLGGEAAHERRPGTEPDGGGQPLRQLDVRGGSEGGQTLRNRHGGAVLEGVGQPHQRLAHPLRPGACQPVEEVLDAFPLADAGGRSHAAIG